MKCYIPLATGQYIPSKILSSLAKQTIDIDIVPACTPGVIKSNHDVCRDLTKKITGEIAGRNLALEWMRASGDEYCLMQDRDMVHLYDDNYSRAFEYLSAHSELAIVTLPWEDKANMKHIRMSGMVIRISALDGFQFRNDGRFHLCMTLMGDLKEKYAYFPDNKKLIYEMLGV